MTQEPQRTLEVSCFGPFELDARTMELRRGDTPIPVKPRPLRLLFYLVQHRDRVVAKEELFEAVWPDEIVSDAALAGALRDLRRALTDDGTEQRWIRTRRRVGYQFVASVRTRAAAELPKPAAAEAPPRTPLCNIPRRPSAFFAGREAETAELCEILRSGDNASVCAAIEGLPGIGKTELALQVAFAFAAEGAEPDRPRTFPGGIFWFNAEDRDLTTAWDQIAQTSLGITGGTRQQRVNAALYRLASSRDASLIILDNAFVAKDERWEEGRGRPFPLPDGPHIRLLVTTRNEYFGGSAFRQRSLGVLSPLAARRVLLRVSGREEAAHAQRLDGLDELLAELDGHALAIEISAVYLRKNPSETPRSLLARMRAGERFDRHAAQTAYAAHKPSYEVSIYGAFQTLWTSLDASVRRAWRQAAQFEPVPVSVELSAAAGLDALALESLKEFHLIEWNDAGQRWLMHRLTRGFAEAVSTPEELAAARETLVRGAAARLAGLSGDRAFEAYVADHSQFDRVLKLAARMTPDVALDLLLRIGPALTAHKGYAAPDVREVYTAALAMASESEQTDRIFVALEGLWSNSATQGDWNMGLQIATSIEQLSRRNDSPLGQVIRAELLSETHFYRGALDESHTWSEKGLELYRALQASDRPWSTVQHPGMVLFAHAGLARSLLGFPEQGFALGERALALANQDGSPQNVAMALSFMVHQCALSTEQVAEYSALVIELGESRQMSIFRDFGAIRLNWARAILEPGSAAQALATMRSSWNALADMSFRYMQSYALGLIADTCARLGLREEGTAAIDSALALMRETGESVYAAELWRIKGSLAPSLEERLRCLTQAQSVARAQNARWWELRAATALARASATPDERRAAREQLARLCATFSEGFALPDFRLAQDALAEP